MYDAPWGEIQIRILAGNLHCILAMSKTTADREECPICKTRYSTNSIRTIPQHCIKACSRCRRAFKDIDLKTVQDYAVFTDALVLKLLHFLQNIGHATMQRASKIVSFITSPRFNKEQMPKCIMINSSCT
uniref:Uncharacterized protein n=1 Tax=Guillardia theta (strain CCMP2712) TaxID=905079 RepID=A0A0C3UC46_GUITC